MDAATIDLAASFLPDARTKGVAAMMRDGDVDSPFYNIGRDNFMAKYANPAFGWFLATQFAAAKKSMPIMLEGRDVWILRAYLMLRNPRKFRDPHVAEAFQFADISDKATTLGGTMRGMLLSYSDDVTLDAHIYNVAKQLGVPVATVDAFENLFFNVIDRPMDLLFLAQELYPNTRLVEFDENYMRNSVHADIIKRVGYNHRNADLTAYLAGVGDHSYLRRIASSPDREAELTKFIIGNALILTHSNLLNQRSAGLSRASSLLAASRQGGAVSEEPPLTGIAALFSEPFQQAIERSKEAARIQRRLDEGITIDIPAQKQ